MLSQHDVVIVNKINNIIVRKQVHKEMFKDVASCIKNVVII